MRIKNAMSVPDDNSVTREKLYDYVADADGDVSFLWLIMKDQVIYTDDKILTATEFTDKAVLCRAAVVPGIVSGVAVCTARSNWSGEGTQPPQNMYFNNLQTGTQGHKLYKCVANVITLLGSETVTLVTGGHYALKLSCTDSTIKSFRGDTFYNGNVNPVPKITVTDTAVVSGRFGVDNGYRTWVQTTAANTYLFALFLTARLQPAASPAKKPSGYAEADIIGKGTPDDPYRANVEGAHSSVIPTDEKGQPTSKTAVVRFYDNHGGGKKLSYEDAVTLAKKLDRKLANFDFKHPESGWG